MKIKGKLKFLILFLLLLSNSSFVFYIFPISFDIIQEFNSDWLTNITEAKITDNTYSLISLGIGIGLIFTSFEISNLSSQLIWRKLKFRLKNSSLALISITLLLISNLIFMFVDNLQAMILVRIISSLFNAIPLVLQQFINENFDEKISLRVNIITYITMAISFLFGTLTSENLPSDELQNRIEGLLNASINKYFLIIILVSIILLCSLFSIIFYKFNVRRKGKDENGFDNQPNQIHVEMKNEEEMDKSGTKSQEKALDKMNKESLVLYSDSLEHSSNIKKVNQSYDSHELNSIMEKDEIMHGNSFREYTEATKDYRTFDNTKNDVSDIEVQNNEMNESILKNNHLPKFKSSYNNKQEEGARNKINNLNRQYLVLENDTRINTVNIVCHTLLKHDIDLKDDLNENNEIEMQVKINNNKEEVKKDDDIIKDSDDFKRNKSNRIVNKNFAKLLVKKKFYSQHGKIEDTSELKQNQLRIINSQNITFRMYLFLAMIYISKVIIFNSFVFFLFAPIAYNGLEMTVKHGGLILSSTCFISSISQMILMKCFIENESRLKRKMTINIIISQTTFGLMILANHIPNLISNYSYKIIFTCITYIMSISAIENLQSCSRFHIFRSGKANKNSKEMNICLPYVVRLIISLQSSLLLTFLFFGGKNFCILILEGIMLATAIISIYLLNKF